MFLNQLYQFIKTFDFSTLYTTIPREHFKTHLKEIIHKVHQGEYGMLDIYSKQYGKYHVNNFLYFLFALKI